MNRTSSSTVQQKAVVRLGVSVEVHRSPLGVQPSFEPAPKQVKSQRRFASTRSACNEQCPKPCSFEDVHYVFVVIAFQHAIHNGRHFFRTKATRRRRDEACRLRALLQNIHVHHEGLGGRDFGEGDVVGTITLLRRWTR